MRVVVGIGASGQDAAMLIAQGARLVQQRIVVVGASRRYANPAWGGATRAPFVNAAVVVDTPLPVQALLAELHAIEALCGRVRARKNAARTLDLDVLWSVDARMPTSLRDAAQVPHPRFLVRPFAVVPAVEALHNAGVVVPRALQEAARHAGLSPLAPLEPSVSSCGILPSWLAGVHTGSHPRV